VDAPRTRDFDLDVDATVDMLGRERPKLLILCSPNNPTGNAIAAADIARVLAATSHATFVMFDEAYFEFNDSMDVRALLERWGGHWLLLRTFSKAYGLASQRIGYGLASDEQIVGYLDRLRPAFNVTALSQIAARAAWADTSHLERTVALTVAERERLQAALADRQIRHTPSKANFVFVECRVPVGQAAERLLSQGLIVRPVPIGPNGWLRITVGLRPDNDRVIAELPAAIGA
jgi:histidinol-phosphate aminotransferase